MKNLAQFNLIVALFVLICMSVATVTKDRKPKTYTVLDECGYSVSIGLDDKHLRVGDTLYMDRQVFVITSTN